MRDWMLDEGLPRCLCCKGAATLDRPGAFYWAEGDTQQPLRFWLCNRCGAKLRLRTQGRSSLLMPEVPGTAACSSRELERKFPPASSR